MYYFDQSENVKQFNNTKDYCIAYAKFVRSKFAKMSMSTLSDIINFVKSNISLTTEELNCEKSERMAVMLSEKRGRAEDIVDFLTLVLFEDSDIKSNKYLMYMANREKDAKIYGSASNPVAHYGLCFSIENEKLVGERYIDINRVYQGVNAIEIFTNEELRAVYSKDFYFTIIDKIYDIKTENISEFYEKLIAGKSSALPRKLV